MQSVESQTAYDRDRFLEKIGIIADSEQILDRLDLIEIWSIALENRNSSWQILVNLQIKEIVKQLCYINNVA